MSEWTSQTLRSLVGKPVSGSRPPGGVTSEGDGIPSLGGENVAAQGGMVYKAVNLVPSGFYRRMPKGHLQPFDVVINKDGAQTGKVGLFLGDFPEACVNEHLFILRSPGIVDQRYLYYSVLSPETQMKIARRITGSAQPGLNSTFVDEVEVALPKSLAEQADIAKILATLDTAIERTAALIAKLGKIKAGMMQDLFTRGIASAGHLRPPPGDSTDLYNATSIGPVPRSWSTAPLSTFLKSRPKNGYSPIEVSEWSGTFALGLGCLTIEGFSASQIKAVLGDNAVECDRALLSDGDLLVSRSNTRDLVGLCGVYRDIGARCIYPDLMMRIVPSEITTTNFLEALLLAPAIRNRVKALAAGTSGSMVKLNSKWVDQLIVAMPRPEEQAEILDRTNSINMSLLTNRSLLTKYQQLRQGLMRDLLVGRVRVKVSKTAEAMA